jgi:predicted alpha/beta superfamily hydrolase/mannose-6-phosphate isomerase-like protein (cupin superfamily)
MRFHLLVLSLSICLSAAAAPTDSLVIHSNLVGEDYVAYINLPGGYSHDKTYPVIYVLDGQWDFPLVSSLYGQQYYDGFVPSAITVGITWGGNNPDYDQLRARDFTPSSPDGSNKWGHAAKFLAFIKQELIPAVEKNYGASQTDRTLIGSSLGGLFTLYALYNETALFSRYILTSPAIGWDRDVIDSFEKNYTPSTNTVRLFMAEGGLEPGAGAYQQFVDRLLSDRHPGLQLQSRILEDMGHSGGKAEGYTRGLQFTFTPPPHTLPSTDLSGYTGIYTDGKDSLKIITEQQSLTAVLGRNHWPLHPTSDQDFYLHGMLGRFHFEKDGRLNAEFYNRRLTLQRQDTLTARTGPQLIGSTRDLSRLDVRQLSLKKGQSDTAESDGDDVLIIVRNGRIRVNDTKTLGPGGVALFSAGDPITIRNADSKGAGYYAFHFRSWSAPDHDRAEKAGPPILLDWTELTTRTTDKGESRQIFDRPVAWLKRIDMHATTLNKGQVSHPPHIHRNEEIILMRSGNVEEYVDGAYQKAKAGDIIFLTSGTPHAVENRTNGRCEYFALQWQQ